MKPKNFGRYVLLKKLGKGGMAEVYLAKERNHIAKVVAIKTILEAQSSSEEFKKMFKEETEIVKNMTHKNIAFVMDGGYEKKTKKYFLTLEYIKGRNLRHLLQDLKLKKEDLSFEEKIYIIKELALGLDYAHRFVHPEKGQLNIVHSDVSPQNVMVNVEGEVKLIDFGISKTRPNDSPQSSNMRAKTLQGKFAYMSPEQASGLEIDQRTDIFSLGIILWELLAKQRLFYVNDNVKILKKIKEAFIPELGEVNPQLEWLNEISQISKKALVRSRNLRYSSAREFHDDLSKLLNLKYPEFNAAHLGQKIQKLYKEEFEQIDGVITAFQNTKIDYREDTKTLTVDVNPNQAVKKAKKVYKNMNVKSIAKKINVDFNKKKLQKPSLSSKNTNPRMNATLTPHRNSIWDIKRRNAKSKISFFQRLGLGVIFICLIGFSAVLYFQSKPEQFLKIKTTLSSKSKEFFKEKAFNDGQLASKQQSPIQLFISSSPSRAKIYFDGVWSGWRTPKQITFQRNKQVTLKSQNYADYTLSESDLEKAHLENNQIFITLQSSSK